MNYSIAIPSYHREHTVQKKTLKVLESYSIDPANIKIFVNDVEEGEYDRYANALKENPYAKDIEIIRGVPTIGAQRNFIERWYPEGTRLMMFDDDIEEVQVKISEQKLGRVEDLEKEIIQQGFDECEKVGAKTFGIYAAANAYFMKDRVYNELCYIIASMFGVIVEHDDYLARVTNHGEDYEYSLRQYVKNGVLTRLDKYTVKSRYYKEEGGLQDVRTKEYVHSSIQIIADLFPELCTMYIRESTGHAELKLHDRNKKYRKVESSLADLF